MIDIAWVPQTVKTPLSEPSYLDVLGLARHPFPVAPDDEHFFVSAHIEQMVAEIVHGIEARKGFMVISGDVGLGKTTITRRILSILAQKLVNTSFVFHTSLKDLDLLREINRDFGIVDLPCSGQESGMGKELQRLNAFLMAQYQQGNNCAIIIDDAQNLDRASLELVRMISNLEADRCKLVQVLLVGQPELMIKLGTPELRQLKSRVFICKAARPLNPDEQQAYVGFKLSLAGNQGRITVTPSAFRYLYRHTGGNFRRLNMLMDRCLYALCRDGGNRIDGDTVRIAQADLLQENKSRRGRVPALAASFILPLLMVIGAWCLHLYTSGGATAAVNSADLYLQTPAIDNAAAHNSPAGNWPALPAPVAGRAPDPAVVDFLRSRQLESLAQDFESARSEGALTQWAERIFRRSGHQLVQLPVLSDSVRRRYGALALPSATGNQVVWLLFWQPTLSIQRFYFGYQGEEIARLQQWLTNARYYDQKIDGVVGPRLMKALLTFQTQSGLPVTGFPDAETLFSLYHRQEGLS